MLHNVWYVHEVQQNSIADDTMDMARTANGGRTSHSCSLTVNIYKIFIYFVSVRKINIKNGNNSALRL